MSAALQSEHRYRGRSLSDGRPTAEVTASYDHASGAYAGASVFAVNTAARGIQPMGHVEYLGYGRRLLQSSLSWDIGATNTAINYYGATKRTVRYNEAYVGLLGDHTSVHLYYSPSYFGGGLKTLYLDMSGAIEPAPDWRVFGHLGILAPLTGPIYPGVRRERFDASAGVARRIGNVDLSLSVSGISPNRSYVNGRRLEGRSTTVSATYVF